MQSVFVLPPAAPRFTRRIAGAALAAAAMAGAPALNAATPDFGPNVLVFDPAMPASQIQATLDSIANKSEFSSERHAVLFKPGVYSVNSQVGYYTSVAGLGIKPDDVDINGGLRVEGLIAPGGTSDYALINFWRSIENLSITPAGGATRWAVSQASPMRRVHVRGGLALMPAWWGYSSGGYIADSKIDGQIQSGSQQQWFSRNSNYASWSGSVWNMVFSGVQGAPATTFPSPPITNLETTPKSREKPFLYIDGSGDYFVFRPALKTASRGTSWENGPAAGTSIPLSRFFIAKPSSSTQAINAALARGEHLLLTPGVYQLTDSLRVPRADTVVLGLGMATLIPAPGKAALALSDQSGITVSSIIIDAPLVKSPVLMQVGEARSAGAHKHNPTVLHDVFFRIGGAIAGSATTSLEVNSADVILDHIWAWRADHGAGVSWTSNVGEHGVVVNGDNVTALGLFVEHYQKNQVVWNGNGGTTIFYQSEIPYDVPDQAAWMNGAVKGYASYAVGARVKKHQAWGLGVYSFFNQGQPIVASSAITAPGARGIEINHAVSVFLSGSGEISHVVNNLGAAANATSYISYLKSN